MEIGEKILTYCFDIDGTLCTDTNGNYSEAQPITARIAHVNMLYAAGHTIKLFTARGSTTGIDWRDLTTSQLKLWNVDHHELLMGKPHWDLFVDDKSIHSDAYAW